MVCFYTVFVALILRFVTENADGCGRPRCSCGRRGFARRFGGCGAAASLQARFPRQPSPAAAALTPGSRPQAAGPAAASCAGPIVRPPPPLPRTAPSPGPAGAAPPPPPGARPTGTVTQLAGKRRFPPLSWALGFAAAACPSGRAARALRVVALVVLAGSCRGWFGAPGSGCSGVLSTCSLQRWLWPGWGWEEAPLSSLGSAGERGCRNLSSDSAGTLSTLGWGITVL